MGVITRDETKVRHFVWMFIAREPVDILAAIRDKHLSACRSDVAPAMFSENSKLVRVFAEPHQVSVGLCEQALEPRVVRQFFDDEGLAHSGIISGLMNPVKQVRSKLVSIGEVAAVPSQRSSGVYLNR